MDKFKFFRKDNYIVLVNTLTQEAQYGLVKEVMVDKSNSNKAAYKIFGVKDFNSKNSLVIDQILKENGEAYTVTEFETFYTQNTGNFNGCGTAPGGGIESITGNLVDNTDPNNPIIIDPTLHSVLDADNVSSIGLSIENGDQALTLSSQSVFIGIETLGEVTSSELTNAHLDFSSDSGYHNVLHPNTGSNSEFYFPEKEGTFTLATTEDLNKQSLQQTLDIGNVAVDTSLNLVSGLNIVQYSGSVIHGVNGDTGGINSIQLVNKISGIANYQFDPNQTGDHTIATLDDIQAPLPIYADNTAAIVGGLVVDNWYKTVTGELRVVV